MNQLFQDIISYPFLYRAFIAGLLLSIAAGIVGTYIIARRLVFLTGGITHGWDDNGVFNFEGGCYAKCIDLDPKKEPDIYAAIRRDALLENLDVDAQGNIDFSSKKKTENTRVSYPIYHIKNIVKPISRAGHG